MEEQKKPIDWKLLHQKNVTLSIVIPMEDLDWGIS